MGSRLVLKDPTLWDLLERVCQERGRRLIDLSYGVAFLERNAHIPKISEIVKEPEATSKAMETLALFAPSQLQIIEVTNGAEVIEFINSLLKRTGGLAHSSQALRIEADETLPSNTNNEKRERATFMGYWRCVDLLHVYGSLLGQEFIVGDSKIVMRPRDRQPQTGTARTR